MPENLRTEGSWRNYIMRHACPATWPDKTIWREFYYGFATDSQKIPTDLENLSLAAVPEMQGFQHANCRDGRPRPPSGRSSMAGCPTRGGFTGGAGNFVD